jgi:hypothetical protein
VNSVERIELSHSVDLSNVKSGVEWSLDDSVLNDRSVLKLRLVACASGTSLLVVDLPFRAAAERKAFRVHWRVDLELGLGIGWRHLVVAGSTENADRRELATLEVSLKKNVGRWQRCVVSKDQLKEEMQALRCVELILYSEMPVNGSLYVADLEFV